MMHLEAIANLTKNAERSREDGVREVLDSIEQVLSFKISPAEKIRLIELYVEKSKPRRTKNEISPMRE